MQDLLYDQKVKELDTLICHFGCCAACARRCVQARLVNLNIYCKFANKEIYLSAYSYFCFTSIW